MQTAEYGNGNHMSEYSNCYQWVKSLQKPPIEGLQKSKKPIKCESPQQVTDEWSLCPNMKHKRHVYQPDHFAGGCLMSLSQDHDSTVPRDFVILGPGQAERLSLGAQVYGPHNKNHSPVTKNGQRNKKRHKHSRHRKSRSRKRDKSSENVILEDKVHKTFENTVHLLSEYRQSYLPPAWKNIVSSQNDDKENRLMYQMPVREKCFPPKDHGVLPTSADEKMENTVLDSNRTMRSEYSDNFTASKLHARHFNEAKKIQSYEPIRGDKVRLYSDDRVRTVSQSPHHNYQTSSQEVPGHNDANHLVWLDELLRRRRLAKAYRERSFASHIWWSEVEENDESVSSLSTSLELNNELAPHKKSHPSVPHKIKAVIEDDESLYSLTPPSSRGSEKSERLSRQASSQSVLLNGTKRDPQRKHLYESPLSASSSDVSSSVTLTSSHGVDSINNRDHQPAPRNQHLLSRSDMKWIYCGETNQQKRHNNPTSKSKSHAIKVETAVPRIGAFVPY